MRKMMSYIRKTITHRVFLGEKVVGISVKIEYMLFEFFE